MRQRRAFTLLELIVVFVIIALLVSIGLFVGFHVVGNSKSKATQNVIQALDAALASYTNDTGAKPPANFLDDEGNEFPLADGMEGSTLIPSTSYLIAVIEKNANASAMLKGISSEFTSNTKATALFGQTAKQRVNNTPLDKQLVVINDAWGRPIRFVHPKYHGNYPVANNRFPLKRASSADHDANIRRDAVNFKDADGGLCTGGRPYFYSAGPDGDPTTHADNVYSITPTFDAVVAGRQ